MQWSTLVVGNMAREASTHLPLHPLPLYPLLRHGDSLTAGAAGDVMAMVVLPDGSGMYYLANGDVGDGKGNFPDATVVYKVGCGIAERPTPAAESVCNPMQSYRGSPMQQSPLWAPLLKRPCLELRHIPLQVDFDTNKASIIYSNVLPEGPGGPVEGIDWVYNNTPGRLWTGNGMVFYNDSASGNPMGSLLISDLWFQLSPRGRCSCCFCLCSCNA